MNGMFWRKWQVWLFFFLVPFIGVVCRQESNEATTPALIAPSTSDPVIFFPQLKPVEGTRETMAAELIGQLVLIDNCLRVNQVFELDNTITSYLLIWPPEFRLNAENNVVQILDGTGQVVAHIGDEIYTGGGEVPDSFVREENRGTCPGPYFEVGEGFRVTTPEPEESATTIPISTIVSSPTIFFPRQQPVNDERAVMEGLLVGELILVDGCLRVKANDSDISYLLVWPPDFSLRIQTEEIEILNGIGQVVARVGDEIHTGGGEVPDNFVSQKTLDTCPGPYVEVGEWVSTPTPPGGI